jgi:hypothetical protein
VAKVQVTAVDADRKRSARRRKLHYTRVRSAEGKVETIYRLDVADESFADQFSGVFQRAVNKARRENRKILGKADLEPGRD